jgi:hypothetical protein
MLPSDVFRQKKPTYQVNLFAGLTPQLFETNHAKSDQHNPKSISSIHLNYQPFELKNPSHPENN